MSERHPSLEELLEGACRTVEEILMPELQTTWARASAVGVVGLLRYALARESEDVQERQDAELASSIRGLAARFPACGPLALAGGDRRAIRETAGASLAFAIAHPDEHAAEAIRSELRPLLARQTADDLAESGPLLQSFMLGSRGVTADAE